MDTNTQNKKSNEWSSFVKDLRKEDYMAILGPNPKEPSPEDFNIDDLTSAQTAYEKNKEKLDKMGLRYKKYLESLEAYKYFLEDQEEERRLEVERRKKSYWFSLDGFEFEEEMRKLFKKTGFFTKVIKTKGSGDGGVDLILVNNEGQKIFVQCKAQKDAVGPHVVRDLYGIMRADGADQGIIVSLGGITSGVREFIEGKNIKAVDVNGVLKMQQMILSSE